MFSKSSRLYSIFNKKCPRCHEGDLFVSENPFVKTTEMHKYCSSCGLKYEKEPGYFYGAMYVTYMLNIALFVTLLVGYFLFLEDWLDWRILMGAYVIITAILVPFYLRLSRVIWLNFWQGYEPDKKDIRA